MTTDESSPRFLNLNNCQGKGRTWQMVFDDKYYAEVIYDTGGSADKMQYFATVGENGMDYFETLDGWIEESEALDIPETWIVHPNYNSAIRAAIAEIERRKAPF